MYGTTTKHNEKHHAPLSNVKLKASIDQVMTEEEA